MTEPWVVLTLSVVYLACMFTAGAATLRKRRYVLLGLGCLLPLLWFVGAFLPPRDRSHSPA